ncbi:uncharacterized protein LOC127806605 [Diospyros lotus]|uniref:uncharacterized protein LOC127806605 n=1 Tax=Diospyros lotus TaxID=55363 RepID=UPI002256DDA9|nr:uncharacterized protein LOC127806605 [Diospyros lotus]
MKGGSVSVPASQNSDRPSPLRLLLCLALSCWSHLLPLSRSRSLARSLLALGEVRRRRLPLVLCKSLLLSPLAESLYKSMVSVPLFQVLGMHKWRTCYNIMSQEKLSLKHRKRKSIG